MSSAFNLDFEVSGIHGYVMMDGVMPALTEITCTFWMKSSDTTNYGTPVSYAVEGSDNAFLLIDYNGSVIYQEIRNMCQACSVFLTFLSSLFMFCVLFDSFVCPNVDSLHSFYIILLPIALPLYRWVLYVNGKERITDCPAVNTGHWYHIGVSWRSWDGDWRIYINGKPSDGGKGLSVGTTIPGVVLSSS